MSNFSSAQTGPKTAEGKAASSRNAIKLGVYSNALMPGESEQELQELNNALRESLNVQDGASEVLLRTISQGVLKTKRLHDAEVRLVQTHLARQESRKEFSYQANISPLLNDRLRDEVFLANFGTPAASLSSGKKSSLNVSVQDFHTFVIVAGLKSQYQTSNGTDLAKGITAFNSAVIPPYKIWKKKATTQSPVDLVTKAVLDWCPSFVKNPNIGSKDGNHRVSLACRFLFFSFPDFPVFNFSKALQKSLILQTRPQDALPYFNAIMSKGMVTNKVLLAKTLMPQPTVMSLTLWKRAKKNGWWKRRVLDLALLLHFGRISARIELKREARRLTRPVAKAKKP